MKASGLSAAATARVDAVNDRSYLSPARPKFFSARSSQRPRLLGPRHKYPAIVRFARLLPDPLRPRIDPTHHILQRRERVDHPVRPHPWQTGREAVAPRGGIERDGDLGHRPVLGE